MTQKQKLKKQIQKAFKQQNSPMLTEVISKAEIKLGKRETEALMVNEIFPKLSQEEETWFFDQVPAGVKKKMHERAKQAVFSILMHEGYTPGKDFSLLSEGGLMISPEAKECILSDLPEESRRVIEEQMFSLSQDPYEMLEDSLGVSFFENLKRIAKARLMELDFWWREGENRRSAYNYNYTRCVSFRPFATQCPSSC